MKIKDTLHLGQTNFAMRAGLPTSEPAREKDWEDNDLYYRRLENNSHKPHWNLHDGPPYANGNIHLGHALNKISKDMIIRYKNMSGFFAPYVPGWDTHGLPIEQQLTKAGNDRKAMSTNQWRNLAREYALKQVDLQKADFKRLGVIADWKNPYITLQPEYEAQQIRVFKSMVESDLIFRGTKPVYWSWSSESALAESEIEYEDIESTSAFYGNKVIDGRGILENGTQLVVWTTTPWTTPASRGISVGPEIEYAVVKVENEKFVVANQLLTDLASEFGWENYQIEKLIRGSEIDRVVARHPYNPDIELLVMNGEHVTLDAGTGLVHTAPGFGEDDFNIGKEYGIEISAPVNNRGIMTEEAGDGFEGVFYQKADSIALDKLKDAGVLIKTKKITHSYPMDWRTHKPIIWRAVPQWFASVDKIRKQILEQVSKVNFSPEWGQKRLYNMIEGRGDWVISRQRVWGVPLPIFYNEDGSAILDPEVIEHIATLFEKYGSDYWFDHSAKELLPEGYVNSASPNGEFTKENDIMDVWFDSGSSWNAVMNYRKELDYPADLYLEGSDQYRGWFNSSLITSVAANGIAPYKSILSQGFVFDGNGKKMSKSLGNIISPNEVADSMGSEITRLWVLSVDSENDVRVSMEMLKQISETYRKIRNTLRFLLANTSDFDIAKNKIEISNLEPLDFYMHQKFNQFILDWKMKFERFSFKDLYQQLTNFINVDLSAFYLDIAKDIVYIEAKNSNTRRSMQTVFYEILVGLTKILTPVLPHTAEELWENLNEIEDYAYLSEMPEVSAIDDSLIEKWNVFFKLRDLINKEIENARQNELIGKNAEAEINLTITEDYQKIINDIGIDLRQILMVSYLETKIGDEIKIEVKKAHGKIDPRDRLFHDDIGADPELPMFSKKNAEIIRTDFPNAVAEGIEE